MFTVNSAGFAVTYNNGWTISVRWGVGNYCANREPGFLWDAPRESCENAEVMACNEATQEIHKFDGSGGDVTIGWVSADDLTEMMAEVAAL